MAEAASPPPPPNWQDAFDSAEIERGRHLFAQACEFVIGAARIEQLPGTQVPEIALAGRSNVGKSSLINALTGRNRLARTSNAPGRTRQINLFSLDGRLLLADLPGYGFAAAPRRERRRWPRLIESYFRGRPNLRRAVLLVDSRHGLKQSDRSLMALLDAAGVTYQVALTKIDKVAGGVRPIADALGAELAAHPAAYPRIAATSAADGRGIEELRAALAPLAATR